MFYKACAIGKKHRFPLEKSLARSGDEIYSELCSPIPTLSIREAYWFLTVYFLKSKALLGFKKYVQIIHKKFDKNVKILHPIMTREISKKSFKIIQL